MGVKINMKKVSCIILLIILFLGCKAKWTEWEYYDTIKFSSVWEDITFSSYIIYNIYERKKISNINITEYKKEKIISFWKESECDAFLEKIKRIDNIKYQVL